MDKTIVIATVGLAILAFVVASVFAYYPFQLQVQPVEPLVIFEYGSNANQSDLGAGNTIAVTLGDNKTSVTITIHPTYHTTYYKNVTRIVNSDNKLHNVYLIIDSISNNLPGGSQVWLIVYSSGDSRDLPVGYPEPQPPTTGRVNVIELTATPTNSPTQIGSLASGGIWEIDFMVYIPEGTDITGTGATFQMHIAYTPSGETPP